MNTGPSSSNTDHYSLPSDSLRNTPLSSLLPPSAHTHHLGSFSWTNNHTENLLPFHSLTSNPEHNILPSALIVSFDLKILFPDPHGNMFYLPLRESNRDTTIPDCNTFSPAAIPRNDQHSPHSQYSSYKNNHRAHMTEHSHLLPTSTNDYTILSRCTSRQN